MLNTATTKWLGQILLTGHLLRDMMGQLFLLLAMTITTGSSKRHWGRDPGLTNRCQGGGGRQMRLWHLLLLLRLEMAKL